MRRHETKLFNANKNGIIGGHNIAIIYRRTSTVVYVHNITCETIHNKMIEGSLEVKLPTIWRDGKAEVGRVREEQKRSEKIREEKK